MHKIYVSTCSAFIKTLFLQKHILKNHFQKNHILWNCRECMGAAVSDGCFGERAFRTYMGDGSPLVGKGSCL